MKLGLDADTVLTPFVSALVENKIEWVARYLKNLDKEEYDALHAAGILVVAIFETTALRSLEGQEAGVEDGTRALAAMTTLGAPATAAVYVTSDTDVVNSNQIAACEQYFAGFDSVIFGHYKIGGYADGTELSQLRQDGMDYCWLAGATGWDGSRDFLENGNPSLVQGIIPRGGEWQGVKWPVIPHLNYDAGVAMVDEFGAF